MKHLIWYLRYIIKYYVRWQVKMYISFCEKNKRKQSNHNITKARLMKAKLIYWQSQFSAFGKFDIGGSFNCGYNNILLQKQEKEMIWMGFTRNIRDKEFVLCKQEAYPQTIDYYPKKHKKVSEHWRQLTDFEEYFSYMDTDNVIAPEKIRPKFRPETS